MNAKKTRKPALHLIQANADDRLQFIYDDGQESEVIDIRRIAGLLAKELAIDTAYCQLNNTGSSLIGNTQGTDLDWLAHTLWQASRLGAADVRTVEWLISKDQWKDVLGLVPEAIFGDRPRFWDACTPDEKDAWVKLARIVMYVIPAFAERVGHRWMEQAKAIREIWRQSTPELKAK